MRFHGVALAAAAAVLALSAGGVLAVVDTEDQHQDAADAAAWDAGDIPSAQTFTAGVSGGIDRISLWAMTADGSVTVEIRDGSPTGTLLGTSSIATPISAGAWYDAAFSPAVQVTALATYSIVINSDGAVRIGGTCAAGG
jgi:hypothetical protein